MTTQNKYKKINSYILINLLILLYLHILTKFKLNKIIFNLLKLKDAIALIREHAK